MLLFIALFVVTLSLVSVLVIWLYRTLFGLQGLEAKVVGRYNTTERLKLRAQQGYISLDSASLRVAKAASPKAGIKAPWGW